MRNCFIFWIRVKMHSCGFTEVEGPLLWIPVKCGFHCCWVKSGGSWHIFICLKAFYWFSCILQHFPVLLRLWHKGVGGKTSKSPHVTSFSEGFPSRVAGIHTVRGYLSAGGGNLSLSVFHSWNPGKIVIYEIVFLTGIWKTWCSCYCEKTVRWWY